jgi:hypothetical protein
MISSSSRACIRHFVHLATRRKDTNVGATQEKREP